MAMGPAKKGHNCNQVWRDQGQVLATQPGWKLQPTLSSQATDRSHGHGLPRVRLGREERTSMGYLASPRTQLPDLL